jgi:hypothetical protein
MRTFRSAIAVIAVTAAAIIGAAGAASASEITSQAGSEVDHMEKSSKGTSNSAEDHMAGQSNDGNIEMPRVKHVWLKNGPADIFGQPTWQWNEINYDGVPDAVILHN